MDLLLQPPGKRGLHRMQVARKKMIGARNQRHMLWFGRCSDRLYEFRLCGEPIVVATQKILGHPALGQEGIIVSRGEIYGGS